MINQNKKKIFYVVTKGNWGGAQRYVYDLATSLPKEKYDVSVILGVGEILPRKLGQVGIRVIKINSLGRDIKILADVMSFLQLLKIFFQEKPDVIHLNSSKIGGIGALAGRLYQLITGNWQLKIIFTVHGWAFNEPRFNNFFTKFFSWLTVFLSTKTIIISKENLEQGLRFPLVKNKFVHIYNGIKDIDFRERNSARKFISDITKAPVKKPWIVTISELHKNKGLEYLIEAISLMDKKPIVFIISPGEERGNLEKLIQKLGLQENFYLMGFIENANSYLMAFDIFTLTSIKEGHPYAILEAGLAKLPVIGSNIPGITDIIGSDKNGILVQSKNPAEIKTALEELLSDTKKMAQLGSNLEKKVKKEFSFEKMLKKTMTLYE